MRQVDEFCLVRAVVLADEIDLAAVHPAAVVDHLEVGSLGASHRAVFLHQSGIRGDVANLDLVVRRAEIVFLLGWRWRTGQGDSRDQNRRGDEHPAFTHGHHSCVVRTVELKRPTLPKTREE